MPSTITPNPSTTGLFSVAERVSADEVSWDGSGWNLYSACPAGGVWCCEDSASEEKREPEDGTLIPFKPFTVYQITACAAGVSRLIENQRMNNDLAESWLASNIEGWLSAGLEIGACGGTGLQDLTDITPTDPMSVRNAVARLVENRQRAGMFDRPVIHMPTWTAAYMCDCATEIGKIADIAYGGGYGILTDNPENGGWMYITGPVQYALSNVFPVPKDSMTERRRNYHDALREQNAAYRFDPCGGFRTQFAFC